MAVRTWIGVDMIATFQKRVFRPVTRIAVEKDGIHSEAFMASKPRPARNGKWVVHMVLQSVGSVQSLWMRWTERVYSSPLDLKHFGFLAVLELFTKDGCVAIHTFRVMV
jgi:hypothetical protein